MAELGHKEPSGRVIDAAIRVQRAPGPGFLESIYGNALCLELAKNGIRYERQKTIAIFSEGTPVGEHRPDLLAEGVLMVELKAVSELHPVVFAIGRSYMKAAGVEDGLFSILRRCP